MGSSRLRRAAYEVIVALSQMPLGFVRGPRARLFLWSLAWSAALAPACQTTVVTFASRPTVHGEGGVTDGLDGGPAGGRDGSVSDGASADESLATDSADGADAPDASSDGVDAPDVSSVPMSPSFDEAYSGGPVTGNSGRYVQVKCCSSAGASDCAMHVLGSAISCLDTASWKENGSMLCQGLKQALFDYELYGKCVNVDATLLPQTKDSARFAQFKCCFANSSCVADVRGGSDLCFDSTTWLSVVDQACTELGGTMQGVMLNGPC
jgi:hypothetical protein